MLCSNEYSFSVQNSGNVHPFGPLCRPRPKPLENHSRGAALPWRGLRKAHWEAQPCRWETLRGNERHYLLPTGNIPCQVTERWALAGTATSLRYSRISAASGISRISTALQSQDGTNWRRRELGPGAGKGSAASHGTRAWCRGRGKKLEGAPARQQAASTFHMTQLATPSEQINNGIFWRQAGKRCWLGTAPHRKITRCYLCGKQHPCLALSLQRGQMWDVAKSH